MELYDAFVSMDMNIPQRIVALLFLKVILCEFVKLATERDT